LMVYRANFALLAGSPMWSIAPGEQFYVFAEGDGDFVVFVKEELNGEDVKGFEHVVDVLRGRNRLAGTVRANVCPEATGIYAEIYRVGKFGLEFVWKMERSSPPRLRIAREEVLAV
jgi:hypothetical protein